MTTAPTSLPAPRANVRVLAAGLTVAMPLLAVLVLSAGRDPRALRSPLIGTTAPAFSLVPAGGGEPIALESLRGRPAVINFWASWCLPCVEEQAALTAAARDMADVQFVGIVYEDDESRAEAFLRQHPTAYPSLIDPQSKTAIAYGVAGVPETFFLDRDGRIVEKHAGPVDLATLEALVARARGAR